MPNRRLGTSRARARELGKPARRVLGFDRAEVEVGDHLQVADESEPLTIRCRQDVLTAARLCITSKG